MKSFMRICMAILITVLIAVPIQAQKVKFYKKDNVLIGINFNDGPGSSDMTLIMRLSGDNDIYVDEGNDVKYIHSPDNEKVKGDWTAVEFDDKKWEDGSSGVGFSDGDDNTETPGGLVSIWTRYHFDAPSADKIKELILLADYDDQYIAWLNGIEVVRSGGAPGNPGEIPEWNASQGGIPNHGSSELAKGKPNKARWANDGQQKTVIEFEFGGGSARSVEAKGKLTTTWGRIKSNLNRF